MILADMEAVILAGGMGTRLREETDVRPKPMVAIGGMPILLHIMKLYRRFGVRRFVVCLGYKGDVIRDYFVNYRLHNADLEVDLSTNAVRVLGDVAPLDFSVVLVETGAETLTGSRVARALDHVRGDTFFATYGDGVADIDIDALYETHARAGKLGTVTAVHPPSRFGEIDIEGHTARTFCEKPQIAEGWINGGFMVLRKAALAAIAAGDDARSLEVDVLPKLAEAGQLAVHKHAGFWQCMDTYRDMTLLNELWAAGKAPWA
ncbi:MAG: glucose-1-phosphate cytidylyltransferase [Tagaea sp.]